MNRLPINVNDLTFDVDPTGYDWFWDKVNSRVWEPETFSVLDRFLGENSRFVDIGSWIGPTALYAASRGAQVDCYECDPVALRVLKKNIKLNPNFVRRTNINEHAIGDSNNFMHLYSNILGNSESSLYTNLHGREGAVRVASESVLVSVVDALDVFRAKGYCSDDQTLVKIDVEGAEFRIIPRLRTIIKESKCAWYISLHSMNINPTDFSPEAARIAAVLNLLEVFSTHNWALANFETLDHNEVTSAVIAGKWDMNCSFIFTA